MNRSIAGICHIFTERCIWVSESAPRFILRTFNLSIILTTALNSPSKAPVYTILKYLGPRFLSLQLPGSSMLLLDLIHACNVVLSSRDLSISTPRSEAVAILGGLLSLPEDFTKLTVLELTPNVQTVSCPDVKV